MSYYWNEWKYREMLDREPHYFPHMPPEKPKQMQEVRPVSMAEKLNLCRCASCLAMLHGPKPKPQPPRPAPVHQMPPDTPRVNRMWEFLRFLFGSSK